MYLHVYAIDNLYVKTLFIVRQSPETERTQLEHFLLVASLGHVHILRKIWQGEGPLY